MLGRSGTSCVEQPPTGGSLRPEDVQIGVYLADAVNLGLYCVVDLRRVVRGGSRVRMAMLENAVTENIEAWDFGRLALLRLVDHRRELGES